MISIEELRRGGIYQILNVKNDKRYVGSSANIQRRWLEHKRCLKRNAHRNSHLQNSWNQHGEESFVFCQLLVCAPKDLLLYEQIYIDYMLPEYNAAQVAGSNRGIKWSEESRRRLSIAQIGKVKSKEARLNMSKSHLGKKLSAETRAKISVANAGREGFRHSIETRAKISAALRLRIRKPCSTETRRKIAAAKLGFKATMETREKMAKSAALAWAKRREIDVHID